MTFRTTRMASLALAVTLGLTGVAACSAPADSDDTQQESTAENSDSKPLAVTDAWVKATDEDMTSAFGELENTTDQTVKVIGANSSVAKSVELHQTIETADGQKQMEEKKDGFSVPAGESLTLEPGGNHLMFMGLKQEIQPGDSVKVDLELEDGSTFTLEAPAKDYTGANENYDDDDDAGDDEHADHDADAGSGADNH